MIGYRRKSFRRAAELLSSIRANPEDLELLGSLQELLISEIKLAEERIRENRRKQEEQPNQESKRYARRSQALRQSIYYWKLFGDAVAFLHCDRFALRTTYYNLHNMRAKQGGGFISKSAGFDNEVEFCRTALAKGLPSLLCDLTNTIRYGDLCLLAPGDPILIEVKSSRTKDRRSARQVRRLKKLGEFFKTDRLEGLRGFPLVQRQAVSTFPISYEMEFNQCINEAYEQGFSCVFPEKGIAYIAVRLGARAPDIFDQIDFVEPWMFSLNQFKRNAAWSPYRPFTLLIESGQALYDFVLGRLFILVILDIQVIRNMTQEMGFEVEFEAESELPLRARKHGEEGEWRVPRQLLLRAPLEAVSIKWLIQQGLRDQQKESKIQTRGS